MTAAASGAAPAPVAWKEGTLVLTRDLDAPRELVFRAWTLPQHFARWFGPHGSALDVVSMDVRPDGVLHFRHRFDDHEDVWVRGVYTDVSPPERIAFTCHFSDPDGNRADRPGFPAAMTIAVTLAEHAGGTRMTIRQTGLVTDQGEVQGWAEGLDRLAALLAAPPPEDSAEHQAPST